MKTRRQKTVFLLACAMLFGCVKNQDNVHGNVESQESAVEESWQSETPSAAEALPVIETPPVAEAPVFLYERYVHQRLNLRTSPSVSGDIISTLHINAKVSVIEKTDTPEIIGGEQSYWYKVDYNGTTGWVFGAYLSESIFHEELLGYWYAIDKQPMAYGDSKTPKWRSLNTYGEKYIFFALGEPGFEEGIMGDGPRTTGSWLVSHGSTISLELESRNYDYEVSKWSENWEIKTIDQDHITIASYAGERQFTRESSEIKRIIDGDDAVALRQYLEKGNDINERMLFDLTPLMYAINNGKTNTAKFLIEHGADVSLKSASGTTVLHFAASPSPDNVNIVSMLLEKGIDVAVKDEFGQTALDMTILGNFKEFDINAMHIRRALTEHGALCSRDDWQKTVNDTVPILQIFSKHSDDVNAVAFSPDGKLVVSGSGDKTVRLWDVDTGQEIRQFTGHSSGVSAVAFSSGGSRIISCSWDGTVRLWDTESGEELKRFEDKDIFWFSASLAGDRILLCTKNAVLLDGELNQIRTFRNMTDLDSAMLSPNGKWAAIAIGRTIGLWDTETGEEIRTIRVLDRISSMAFNDDSSQLVSYNGSIQIWDLETGEKTVEVVRNLWVYRLAFVPGTDLVLSVDAQRMTLWDDSGRITTGNDSTSKEIGEYDANTLILSIVFNNNGTQFLLGMADGTVMLWDASIWH